MRHRQWSALPGHCPDSENHSAWAVFVLRVDGDVRADSKLSRGTVVNVVIVISEQACKVFSRLFDTFDEGSAK
jgi:hypothetical protein